MHNYRTIPFSTLLLDNSKILEKEMKDMKASCIEMKDIKRR